jgi:hypothetical protein
VTEPEISDEAVRAYGYAYDSAFLRGTADDTADLARVETDAIRGGLAAAYPILAEQWRRKLDGGPDEHVIDLRDDGWTIRHPLSCRPNLFDCEVNRAAGRMLTEQPDDLGRFVCWVDAEGVFTIGDPLEVSGGS